MFGRNNSIARQAADTPATPADNGPTFPIYLLPSFSLPFRRRRPSSPHHSHHHHQPPASTSYNDNDNEIQDTLSPSSSLSSSPASSASDNPNSPNSNFDSYFTSDIPDLHAADTTTTTTVTTAIVSKGFTGRHGRAYLVSPPASTSPETASANLINTTIGRSENRRLVTGDHVVADISCLVCGTTLGWKYVDAREASQRYKVGKFILETKRVVRFRSWEDVVLSHFHPATTRMKKRGRGKASLGDGNAANEGQGKTSSDGMEESDVPGNAEAGPRDNGKDKEGADGADDAEVGGVIVFDSDDEDECDDIFAGVWDAEVVAERRRGRVNNRRRNDVGVLGY
ncbi:hypothetical protein B0T19DRAFT_441008 [Cercophora scortea]|uniref:Yippee domain-containing protein n=1 Tax=Cercophora scortea TaxID=314031 RepID=A0AAE0ILH7_9PEZI|nr:hypothetical protein B0T19DRAFT_441008 [Cercophora scortea]